MYVGIVSYVAIAAQLNYIEAHPIQSYLHVDFFLKNNIDILIF